jgi:hypothetical protein
MQLTRKHQYRLDLTQEELRVVGLALLGKWESVKVEASKLNQRLLEERRRIILDELDLIEGAMEIASGERSATPGQEDQNTQPTG